jgi:tripartite-type tricarboxylate transporter receptor subunit TctC
MKLPRRNFLHLAAGAVALPAVPRIARAQAYPSRPVRVIVPFAPGGTTDIFARLVAQKLTERFGTTFYVENIAGASGNIGTAQAARAASDGHTVYIAFTSFVVNPTMFDRVPYDPLKDFEPVTLAVSSTHVLSINPSLPAKSVRDLVGLIKTSSGKYSFASSGVGTPAHLLGEMLRLSQNLDLVHVPFGGGAGPAMASVVAGHTQVGFSTLASAGPHINDGKLRALAVTSKARSPMQPDLPTMAEAGYPDIGGDAWVGVLVPARTPKDIVTLLHREIVRIIALPDMRERLAAVGFETVGSAPEQFAAHIKNELDTWGRVIRAANIKAE